MTYNHISTISETAQAAVDHAATREIVT